MITVEHLIRTYGSFTAVDDISFTARPGRVTGFLGPNGAGKSTTMRVLVGLTPATSGTATIDGRPFAALPNPAREVGVLLDASAQHAGRTGREILTIAQRTLGMPAGSVDAMLERVSLTEAESRRRVRHYSLGMRQRLGIAVALIGEPHVLILDEPANGLDPAGIRWMRDLLRDYADRGGTVLLSSHLLHEIEVIADDLVVIGNGRIVASGTKAELLAGAGTLVRTRETDALARALADSAVGVSPVDSGLLVDAEPELVGKVAHAAGIPLVELRPADGAGLEEMFLQLTADTQRDDRRRAPPERSRSMSTLTAVRTPDQPLARPEPPGIPFSRVVSVELRKMFDTRSGFWLLASIGILSLLATTAVILFAPDSELDYETFATAIGFPMAVVLPMIAILSVTSEWSQRTGLTTFTLVPHRGRVIGAKAICAVGIGVVSMILAAGIGAVGNVVGTAIAGVDTVWNLSVTELGLISLANVLGLLVGFMLGVLLRSSPAAIVAYFVYNFVLTALTELLAATQQWFADLRPWVDFNYTQGPLFEGSITAEQWANLGVAGLFWLVIPLAVGLALVTRSEVK